MNSTEIIRENDRRAKKRKRTIKTILGTVVVIGGLGALAHSDVVLDKLANFKLPIKPANAQAETTIPGTKRASNGVSDVRSTTTKWSREYFEELVSQYMYENPYINEDVARSFLAMQYRDELMKYNPELLYELTGIYEYEELTDEKFYAIVNDAYVDFRRYGLNLTVEDVTKFVAIVNIDQLAQDNPELLASILGNQNPSEFITDAFKVTGAIKNKNYDIYQNGHSTEKLIRVSDYVFDKKAKSDLILIESYVDRANAVKGNKQRQDAIISELMGEIQRPDGRLYDMEDGVGFASTIAFDSLINYVSFNDKNVRIISNVNFSALMNHDTLELYLSNIYGNLNKCNPKKLTK